MSPWTAVLLGSAVSYAIKLSGYLVPGRWLERPGVAAAAGVITAGLLAALVVVQTLGGSDGLVLDARVPALAVAAILLWARAPFIVVVAGAALVAAGLRTLG